jgi:hypothetical protein
VKKAPDPQHSLLPFSQTVAQRLERSCRPKRFSLYSRHDIPKRMLSQKDMEVRV